MALFKVRYKGLSDIREMSKKDLADAGVGVDGNLRWDRLNRNVVFIENPSDELLTILRSEGTFTIQEVDAAARKEVGDPIVTGASVDDTGQVVKDGTKR